MQSDIKEYVDLFNDFEEEEQLEILEHFKEIIVEIFDLDIKKKINQRYKERYKNDEEFRNKHKERCKKYYERKKRKIIKEKREK